MAVERGVDVLALIGATGGIVGAVTGVWGLVLSLRSVRRVEQYKALDLRVDLGKRELTLRDDIKGLPKLLEDARRSRRAVAAARGYLNSGYMTKFESEWSKDESLAGDLATNADFVGQPLDGLDHAALEKRTFKVHELERLVADLEAKYRDVLAKDDADRGRLAAENHERTMARMRTPPK